MTKARLALAAICLFAGIGGAVAFKARITNGFIKTGPLTTDYSIVQVPETCTFTGPGCLYTNPFSGVTYQLLQLNTVAKTYYPVRSIP